MCVAAFDSRGEWYPFKNETADGYDSVEWAAALPYSNGKVGMFGGSYEAVTQMLAAMAHPPHLAGIFPVVTGSTSTLVYEGGAFEHWLNGILDRKSLSRCDDPPGPRKYQCPCLDGKTSPVVLSNSESDLAGKIRLLIFSTGSLTLLMTISGSRFPSKNILPIFPFLLCTPARGTTSFSVDRSSPLSRIEVSRKWRTARRGQRLMIAIGGHAGEWPKDR